MKIGQALVAFGLIASSSLPRDAQAQDALSAWNAVSRELRDCIDVAARRANITLAGMIASGVLPSDSRLTDTMRVCRQLVEGLKTNYPCAIKLTTGQIVNTQCNQYFGYREGSGYRKVSKEEALRDAFTPRWANAVLIDEESPEGRRQREEAIRQALDSSQSKNVTSSESLAEEQRQVAARSETDQQRLWAERLRREKEKADQAAQPTLPPAGKDQSNSASEQPGWSSKVMSWFSSAPTGQGNINKASPGTESGNITFRVVQGVDAGIANFIAIGLVTSLKNPKANGRFFEAAIIDAIAKNNVTVTQETDCKFSIEAKYSTASLPRQSVKWDGSPDESAVMRELMKVDFAGADESRTKIVELEETTRIELSGKWVGYNEKWMITRHEMGDGYAKDGAILQSPFFNVLQELSLPRLVLHLPNRLGGRPQAISSLKKIFAKCS